jgi:hypothetical protein
MMMDTHLLALQLMAAQGCLGAFDTIYHHELTETLAQRRSAGRELSIHAIRALIYGVLFVGLSAWTWHGVWALALLAVFGIEIVLTLWDFVIEDRTRLLPASERITHTILAINGGAFIILLTLNAPAWSQQPTALQWQPHGLLSWFLVACGLGVGFSGLRDAFAAMRICKQMLRDAALPLIHFSDKAEQVLVTGATGFIGQQLVQVLLTDGHQVTVLTRNPKAAAWLFDGKVQCIASMEELAPSRRIDVIVNLAGARVLGWRWTAARQAVLRRSRIDLTQRLVTWIVGAEHKPRLLLSASAIGYYGIQAKGDNTVLNEDSPPQAIFMSELCQDWECAAGAASASGVRIACIRLGVVFGEQGPLPMMLMLFKLGVGGKVGRGNQWLSWIHVRDVLRGMAHIWRADNVSAMTNTVQIYNFTTPQSVTQEQFSQIAAKVLHRPCLLPMPSWPMRLALGKQADLLLEGQRVAPTRLQAAGFSFDYPDLKGALQSVC